MSLPFSIHVLCLNFFNQKRGEGEKGALQSPPWTDCNFIIIYCIFFLFIFPLFLRYDIKFPARTRWLKRCIFSINQNILLFCVFGL